MGFRPLWAISKTWHSVKHDHSREAAAAFGGASASLIAGEPLSVWATFAAAVIGCFVGLLVLWVGTFAYYTLKSFWFLPPEELSLDCIPVPPWELTAFIENKSAARINNLRLKLLSVKRYVDGRVVDDGYLGPEIDLAHWLDVSPTSAHDERHRARILTVDADSPFLVVAFNSSSQLVELVPGPHEWYRAVLQLASDSGRRKAFVDFTWDAGGNLVIAPGRAWC